MWESTSVPQVHRVQNLEVCQTTDIIAAKVPAENIIKQNIELICKLGNQQPEVVLSYIVSPLTVIKEFTESISFISKTAKCPLVTDKRLKQYYCPSKSQFCFIFKSDFKGRGWRYSESFLLSANPMKRLKPMNRFVCVSNGWYLLFICAVELHCCEKLLKTYQRVTLLHWVTWFLITMNTGTV